MGMKKGAGNPYLLLLTTMVLWGVAFSSSEVLVDHVPHSVGALLRFGGGAIALLLAVALFDRHSSPVPARNAWLAAAAGVLGVFAYNGFFFWGLSLAPSLDAGIVIPVMSPVLTSTFLLVSGKEKANWARVLGLALGLIGAVVFFLGAGGSAGGGSDRLLGDALFFLSAVCWAAFTLVGPRVMTGMAPLRATTYATWAGAVLLGILAVPDLGKVEWTQLPSNFWLNALFLAVGAAAVANLLYYRGVGAVGPANASLMMFNVPIVNTLCATLALGESFGWLQGTGACVLLVGAAIAVAHHRLTGRSSAKRGSVSDDAAAPAELGVDHAGDPAK